MTVLTRRYGGLTQTRAMRYNGRTIAFRLFNNPTWYLGTVEFFQGMGTIRQSVTDYRVELTEVETFYVLPED